MVKAVKLSAAKSKGGTQITGNFNLGHVGKENRSRNTNTDNFNYFNCFYRSCLKRYTIFSGLPQDNDKLTK